jgi:U3 small nucleolar RNA-associated protein 22
MAKQPPPPDQELYDTVLAITTPHPIKPSSLDQVCDILKYGYSNRITALNGWLDNQTIYVGLFFNATIDFARDIDRGPHPKAPEADSFRSFWGSRSSLKRFPDGSLLESVAWGDSPLKELPLFCLHEHFDPDVRIEFSQTDLSPLFELPNHQPNPPSPAGAYDELVTALRSIETTVRVISVSARSHFLRGTAVFPYEQLNATSHFATLCPHSIRILAKLESSPAWPLELKALLQFKIAVYLEISEKLSQKQIISKPHYEGLTIFFRGFVFELEAIHADEVRHFIGSPHGNRIDLIDKCEVVHHSYIAALTKRFGSFAEATRAAVRWVRSKGISSQVLRQEAIELAVAAVYSSAAPRAFPMSGFLRFLGILSQKFIAINDVKPATDVSGLDFVLLASHCRKSEFTQGVPHNVTSLLRSAAQQSLQIALRNRFTASARLLPRLFAVPTTHWKLVCYLEQSMRPHNEFALFADKRKKGRFEVKTKTVPPVEELLVDFDPVASFVGELGARFGELLSFWYDELGGPAIGVSFLDEVLASKSMKPEHLRCAAMDGEDRVAVRIDLIEHQIRIIGGDLIRSIERRV